MKFTGRVRRRSLRRALFRFLFPTLGWDPDELYAVYQNRDHAVADATRVIGGAASLGYTTKWGTELI